MKHLCLTVFALIISSNVYAAPLKVVESCVAVETAFATRAQAEVRDVLPISSLKGPAKTLALRQSIIALSEAGATNLGADDYVYTLDFLGTEFDAINIDLGGNGRTSVFVKGTTTLTNIAFFDGDLYVDGSRCLNVQMPGDTQF